MSDPSPENGTSPSSLLLQPPISSPPSPSHGHDLHPPSPSSTHSHSSLQPFPYLPLEIKHEILRFADQPTLASACRSSLAFFQLSSPLLYRDVVLRGYDGLHRMLCAVNPSTRLPQLNPYLDLSQIKTMLIILEDDDAEDDDYPPVPFRLKNRLPSSGLLSSVEAVTLQVLRTKESEQPFSFFNLLSLFDPVHFTFHGTSSSNKPDESYVYLDLGGLDFPRLQSVTFLNSGAWEHLRACILTETNPPFTVIHDVVNRWPFVAFHHSTDSISNALDDVFGGWAGNRRILDEASILNSSPLKMFVFRVAKREQAREIEAMILGTWVERGVEVGKQARWAKLIEFEEVETGSRSCFRVAVWAGDLVGQSNVLEASYRDLWLSVSCVVLFASCG